MTANQQSDLSLTLYVRSLRPRQCCSRQDAVLDRLDALEREGTVTGYEVVVLGRHVPRSVEEARTPFGESVLERLTVFEEWARRNGYSLESVLPERESKSQFTGEEVRAREVPQLALAEYEGDSLRFVSPVVRDGEMLTVEERLDAIERGDASDGQHLAVADDR
jgi:hypothetical protein